MTVRCRVAPSPTGDPHVGTAYQALFNLAFAHRHGGQFVLRIEDTDRERSSAASETAILESLRWLGLQWDEGPEVGGPHGPYRQSERLEIYLEHAKSLLERGYAYRDFTTREELVELRQKQKESKEYERYERRYRDLDPQEAQRRSEAGEPHTLRLKVPVEGECVMQDLLRSEIRREWSLVDDQILLKSDGFPTYHLANVVDDHLMGITHVIRGEEWINSLPKHLLLYAGFGWEPPVFCHLPLLRNPDANKTKLSKRKNPTSIEYYRRAGYVPEALVNFLALMGVKRAEGEEKLSLDELISSFRLEDITLGGPVFDPDKLRWLNGRYLREEHSVPELRQRLQDWALNAARIEAILPLARQRLETLSDWGPLTSHFFTDLVDPPVEELVLEGHETKTLVEVFQRVIWRFEGLRGWEREDIEGVLREFCEEYECKMRDFARPFYVAMSGKPVSTPLFESMVILGSDLTRARLRKAIEVLGGISGKQLKKLEKRFR